MAKKILLIDDERGVTEMVSACLQLRGYTVEAVNKSEDAVRLLGGSAYDLVITDLMMPGVKGMSFIEELRALKGCADLPLFVISAKTLSDDERKFLLVNKAHFLQKPFSPRGLVEMLKDSLTA